MDNQTISIIVPSMKVYTLKTRQIPYVVLFFLACVALLFLLPQINRTPLAESLGYGADHLDVAKALLLDPAAPTDKKLEELLILRDYSQLLDEVMARETDACLVSVASFLKQQADNLFNSTLGEEVISPIMGGAEGRKRLVDCEGSQGAAG